LHFPQLWFSALQVSSGLQVCAAFHSPESSHFCNVAAAHWYLPGAQTAHLPFAIPALHRFSAVSPFAPVLHTSEESE
jgi:hypothetical protein